MDLDDLYYPDEPRLNWDKDDITKLVLWGTRKGMSDIILNSGDVAYCRVHGEWRKVTRFPFNAENLLKILNWMARNSAADGILTSGQDYDFSFEIEGGRFERLRYRGNATPIADDLKTGISITLRSIPTTPPTLDALDIEPGLKGALFPNNGLVLVTGVMGSGKSTLLAAVLREAAVTLPKHISTYESPIEFTFAPVENKLGPFEQSEVPRHLKDFLSATRNSTRRAPDIVLIGESRDAETLRGMLESAEIGVAAYSTVHTRSVSATPTRIINVFNQEERTAMAASLIKSLRVIVQQRLYACLNGGRVAAREYLVFTEPMREKLASLPLPQLDSAIEKLVQAHGQPLEVAVKKLLDAGLISHMDYEAVKAEKSDKNNFNNLVANCISDFEDSLSGPQGIAEGEG